MDMAEYTAFLEAKVPVAQASGFACSLDDVPTHLIDGRPLKDHQRAIVRWAVEGGRRALFEAFGLGKSIQQLLILDIIVAKVRATLSAGQRALIVAPGAHRPDTWDDVARMRTLNANQARKGAEAHICPLQFDIVDRLIDRYSMAGELVFDPFAGLGTVPLRALEKGRRGYGSELNPDYFAFACQYLRDAEAKAAVPSLFDLMRLEQAV